MKLRPIILACALVVNLSATPSGVQDASREGFEVKKLGDLDPRLQLCHRPESRFPPSPH